MKLTNPRVHGPRARSVVAILLFGVALGASQPAHAALTFFPDRAAFESAHPGLDVEDFEEGAVFRNFSSPLDSASDNRAFHPGDILPGVAFSNSDPAATVDDLILLDGSGVVGLPSKALSKALDSLGDSFGSGLDITFAGDHVFAVGLDAFLDNTTGVLSVAETRVSIFGSAGLLDTVTLFTSASGPVFFGVASDLDPIKRINVDGVFPGHFSFELVDNVSFASSVPTPGVLALMITGLAILVPFASTTRRRL